MAMMNRKDFPLRPQTINGNPVEIYDASDYYAERQAHSSPDLDIIEYTGLFLDNEVIIGIGRPNVFTLIPDGEGNHLRFAAKSLYRAPSKLEETKKRVQSSIFFILTGLSEEQISKILKSAEDHEGTKNITCVKENMQVLSDAGITLGNNTSLESILFPKRAFEEILKHGLKMEGEDISIDTLKTTRRFLENQVFQSVLTTWMTPIRHGKRLLIKKGILREEDSQIRERKIDYPVAPVMESDDSHMNDISLTAAITPKISKYFRRVWGAHNILGIKQDRVDIDKYLKDELVAYPDKNPSILTWVKKNILFNRLIVGGLNSFLQLGHKEFKNKTESELHTLFETHSEKRPCKYNLIVSGNESKLMKVETDNPTIDWVLSKHVLISNYHPSVRFAGEVWKDEEGIIWVNRNSGTYIPTEEQLNSCVAYLQEIFPHVVFKADYAL